MCWNWIMPTEFYCPTLNNKHVYYVGNEWHPNRAGGGVAIVVCYFLLHADRHLFAQHQFQDYNTSDAVRLCACIWKHLWGNVSILNAKSGTFVCSQILNRCILRMKCSLIWRILRARAVFFCVFHFTFCNTNHSAKIIELQRWRFVRFCFFIFFFARHRNIMCSFSVNRRAHECNAEIERACVCKTERCSPVYVCVLWFIGVIESMECGSKEEGRKQLIINVKQKQIKSFIGMCDGEFCATAFWNIFPQFSTKNFKLKNSLYTNWFLFVCRACITHQCIHRIFIKAFGWNRSLFRNCFSTFLLPVWRCCNRVVSLLRFNELNVIRTHLHTNVWWSRNAVNTSIYELLRHINFA